MECAEDYGLNTYLNSMTPDPQPSELQQSPSHGPYHYPLPPANHTDNSVLTSGFGIPHDNFQNDTLSFQLPSFLVGCPTSAAGGGADALPGSLMSAEFGNWFGPASYQDMGKQFRSSKYQDGAGDIDGQMTHQKHSSPPRKLLPDYSSHNAPFSYSTPSAPTSDFSNNTNNTRHESFQPPPPPPLSSYKEPMIPPTFPSAPINSTTPITGNKGPPLYSSTGFDMLGILARVASRPNPSVVLGPVDFSCSFVVVDVKRYDHPIVYASPTFFKLTGYDGPEVIGRNCRFLQAPDGIVDQGSTRTFTDHKAVAHLRKSLHASKECQANLMNYRKGGVPFLNLVSVIPITWDGSEDIRYHVGFQVDLVHQPNAILQTMKDGTYLVNYSTVNHPSYGLNPSAYSSFARDSDRMTGLLTNAQRVLLNDVAPPKTTELAHRPEEQIVHEFHTMLLDNADDFIHVLSVKGVIQYVSPSLLRALEYTAEELIGRPVSHIAHPQDLTPVTRELKEASAIAAENNAIGAAGGADAVPHTNTQKTVNLMFRVRRKRSGMMWLESSGRLHVEPGKTRKSIIFSGRLRELPTFTWSSISGAGGLGGPSDIWAKISFGTCLVAFISSSVQDVLGFSKEEMTGASLSDYIKASDLSDFKSAMVQALHRPASSATVTRCSFMNSENAIVEMEAVFFPPEQQSLPRSSTASSPELTTHPTDLTPPKPSTILCQFRLATRHNSLSAQTSPVIPLSRFQPDPSLASSSSPPVSFSVSSSSSRSVTSSGTMHTPNSRLYEELDATRGTNWNYEVETIKKSNEKMKTELQSLNTQVALGAFGTSATMGLMSNGTAGPTAGRRGSLAGLGLVPAKEKVIHPRSETPPDSGYERKRRRTDSGT